MIDKLNNSPLNLQATSVYNFNEFSLTELLNKFFMSINDCIDSSNQALNFLVWLKGEGLPSETIKELNNMYNDGRLENIINKEIFGEINKNISDMSISINENQLEIENNKNNILKKAEKIHTAQVVNVGAFNVFPNDLTKDSTQGIKDAIAYCESIGGGTVYIPSGKYLVNGTIYVNRKILLKGNGKTFGGGTVLWRNEGTGLTNPFIQLGNETNNGAMTLGGVQDLVIIGDSTVSDIIGVENKGVGVHGIVLKNIEFECFAGVPIKLSSQVETSRVQFIEIDNIDVGFDWGNYKTDAITPKTNNNICGGVWLEGYVDGIYIRNCRFTNYINTNDFVGYLNANTSYGVRIESYNGINPKNNFHIENTFFRGFKACVYNNSMNLTLQDCYIEHSKNVVLLDIKDVSSVLNIHSNYVSGCEKLVSIVDNRTSKVMKNYVNSWGNYFKWGVFEKSYLYDVEEGTENLYINNGYNVVPSTYAIAKFEIATDNAKPFVFGVTKHNNDYQKLMLCNPKIASEGETVRYYTIKPNTSNTNDYGVDILNTEGNKVVTFHDKNTQLYTYVNGTRTTVLRTDETSGRCEFPTNIILRGSGGKRYVVGIGDDGNVFTQEIV